MTINKKELKKLSPGERIKKLRLLEEERKKEVAEIGHLIRESMQELRTEKIAEEIAPEQRAVDISRLFEASGEQRLERTARDEVPPAGFIKGAKMYLTFAQAYQDYLSLKSVIGYAAMGTLNEEQSQLVDAIGERLDKTRYESLSTEVANIAVTNMAILSKIRRYRGI